jgi:polyhydroxybutyrate depolymerase
MGAQKYAGGKNIDDVGFVTAVVTKMVAEYNIDPTRIYLTGSSNGCGMAQEIAYRESHWVAAVACHSMYLTGAEPGHVFHGPEPGYEPVPVMEIHGEMDEVVAYEKGKGQLKYVGLGAEDNFHNWKTINSCKGDPVEEILVPGKIRLKTHHDCAGNNTKVALLSLEQAGHHDIWDRELNSVKTAWAFMSQYQKPVSSMMAFRETPQEPILTKGSPIAGQELARGDQEL